MEPWPTLPCRLGQQPSLLSSSSELLPSAIALLRDPAFSASLTLSCSGRCWQILMPSSVPLFLNWHLSLRETFLAFWYDPFTFRRCILAGIFHDLPLCPVLLPPPRYFPHLLPLPSPGPGLFSCLALFSFGTAHAHSGSTVRLETGHLWLMGPLALRVLSLLPH